MDLFVDMFKKECDKIHNENIKVVVSGRRENLRPDVLEAIDYIVEKFNLYLEIPFSLTNTSIAFLKPL